MSFHVNKLNELHTANLQGGKTNYTSINFHFFADPKHLTAFNKDNLTYICSQNWSLLCDFHAACSRGSAGVPAACYHRRARSEGLDCCHQDLWCMTAPEGKAQLGQGYICTDPTAFAIDLFTHIEVTMDWKSASLI